MEPKTREELVQEAEAATDEQLAAKVAFYRMHVGAKKTAPPGVRAFLRLAMDAFEAEQAKRRSRG